MLLPLVGCTAAPRQIDAGPDSPPAHHDTGLDYRRDIGPAPPRDAWIGDLTGDVWEGTVACPFASGSSRVRIVLDHVTSDGPRTGIVILGEGVAPPLPSRDIGYPPGFDDADLGRFVPYEGFAYPIANGWQSAGVVSLVTYDYGVFEAWCELQVPVPLGDGRPGYGVLPAGQESRSSTGCVYAPYDGPSFPIDCARLAAADCPDCCACTAGGCASSTAHERRIEFTIGADGEGWGATDDPCRPHVTRT